MRYLDDLILRDQSSTRHYVLHDYFNVTTIVDTSGNALERYGYDGFGTVRFMNASFGSASSSYTWETLYGAYRYDATTASTRYDIVTSIPNWADGRNGIQRTTQMEQASTLT